ncbi:putative late blight resistance protein homolog r1a-6 [Phtheirospermum japonicum]|uniref:Putative late blight resistance protein homolog r1a-6 n=1 Tax=Phtheirospermum japonicum TaxID=374723 RepID=A0A830BYI1_9LAMI|nr:putative late blight resistance protein homolog r1a-6 [Phtheirospermum japonicum]
MAAYAALVSVMHIIDQIQSHPRPPISLDKDQVQSITEKVIFLQDYLENYLVSNGTGGSDDDAEGLESRICDAAYAAEDMIESYIVDTIEASTHGKESSSIDNLYDGLEKVIQRLDMINIWIKEKTTKSQDDDPIPADAVSLRGSSSSSLAIVGLDDVLIEIMDKLTGQQSSRQIIPIVGMGGIGKTTLVRSIYANPLIVQYFDFRGWATISQEFNSKDILLQVLVSLNIIERGEMLSQMSEHEIGDKLYKDLFGRRYLIVMDDIWRIEAWDKVKTFFPDNNDGSAIMLTTRLSNLASQLNDSSIFPLSFLSEDESWKLFCKSVFEEGVCPIELEDFGKKIARNCKGLPLSIVVVGGLLAKSKRTREYWQYIAENSNSIMNLEDDERCLRILRMSYNQLPVHLKPCFLYMGVYQEDSEIYVPKLIKLWVAEGFLKPISGKCLEVVAEEYLDDLFDRNLVLVSQRGCSGKIKRCKIHDLLLDLCVSEAKKHKFLCVNGQRNPNNLKAINTQRRIAIHQGLEREVYHGLLSTSLVRSLTLEYSGGINYPKPLYMRLLRVLTTTMYRSTSTCEIVNCRYLDHLLIPKLNLSFPSSISILWNLQTLIVTTEWGVFATSEIWKMPQLRHVKFIHGLNLLDPPPHTNEGGYDYVLENLQTLSDVRNFKLREELIKRIPNIKKLKLIYDEGIGDWSSYHLNNLALLLKMESLFCYLFYGKGPSLNLNFPRSLKKLNLRNTNLQWEEMGTKIGSLPQLQVLKLQRDAFIGTEWETVEGQFQSLKYLEIVDCDDLIYWRTESTHFPCLERLVLYHSNKLKEIPPEIGEIPTLESIELHFCSDSVVISTKEIVNEQEDLGNEGLQVRVRLREKNKAVESLTTANFQVVIW